MEETQGQEEDVPGARQLSEVEVSVQLAERQMRLLEEIQERETAMARALALLGEVSDQGRVAHDEVAQ